ncbi:hypothetical protein [Erythrobacter colymbi]|uniref:hypothetical protein n=1 Tax=Erythrobacter colymbi TaxID=1161202 RepID=UPI0012DE5533|nr:hypothetical protein [Erythrobacter colymbi]
MLSENGESRAVRKGYVTPRLAIYGSFTRITASGSGAMVENGGGMGMGAGSPQPNRRP